MLIRTEGVVLKTFEYGDADLIATYFTKDYGLLKGFVKGVRKFKSRFGSSLEPLTHVRLSFLGKENTSLPKVTQSDILNSFYTLRDDLATLISMAPVIDVVLHLLQEKESHPRKYALFLAALKTLEKAENRDVICLAFRVKFLWMAGYGPRVGECGGCGKQFKGSFGLFYPSQGSLLCRTCSLQYEQQAATRVSSAAINFFGQAKSLRFDQILTLRLEAGTFAEVRNAVDLHISYLTGRRIMNG